MKYIRVLPSQWKTETLLCNTNLNLYARLRWSLTWYIESADLRETPCVVYELTEGSVRSISLVQEVSYDGLFLWVHLRKMYRDTRVLCFYL